MVYDKDFGSALAGQMAPRESGSEVRAAARGYCTANRDQLACMSRDGARPANKDRPVLYEETMGSILCSWEDRGQE